MDNDVLSNRRAIPWERMYVHSHLKGEGIHSHQGGAGWANAESSRGSGCLPLPVSTIPGHSGYLGTYTWPSWETSRHSRGSTTHYPSYSLFHGDVKAIFFRDKLWLGQDSSLSYAPLKREESRHSCLLGYIHPSVQSPGQCLKFTMFWESLMSQLNINRQQGRAATAF